MSTTQKRLPSGIVRIRRPLVPVDLARTQGEQALDLAGLNTLYGAPMRDLMPMATTEQIEIRRLVATEVHEQLDALAAVLADCVAGGASVSYMAPFSHEQARGAFAAWAVEVEQGRRLVLAAFADGDLVGTVQVVLAMPPNQPHRAEIAKLLVHRLARKRGIAQRLMEHAESEARAEGKTLLVLDAVTDGDAARLYERLGWTTVGVIPGYALYPDGRPCDTTVFWKAL
jgi:GNAT superfamily N-acetyltransferase